MVPERIRRRFQFSSQLADLSRSASLVNMLLPDSPDSKADSQALLQSQLGFAAEDR